MIAQALATLVYLAGAESDFEAFSRWLRAPYWGRPAAPLRARLDVRLRERPMARLRLRDFLGALGLVPADLQPTARELNAQLTGAAATLGEGSASPRLWSERFAAALSAAGWPGPLAADGVGQQTRLRWHELLDELGGLTAGVAPRAAAPRGPHGVARRRHGAPLDCRSAAPPRHEEPRSPEPVPVPRLRGAAARVHPTRAHRARHRAQPPGRAAARGARESLGAARRFALARRTVRCGARCPHCAQRRGGGARDAGAPAARPADSTPPPGLAARPVLTAPADSRARVPPRRAPHSKALRHRARARALQGRGHRGGRAPHARRGDAAHEDRSRGRTREWRPRDPRLQDG